MEGELRTWILMVVPLVVLATNLLFPRSRIVKILALLFLVFAATLHGLLAHNQIDRSLRAVAGRLSSSDSPILPAEEAQQIKAVDVAVTQYGFDVWLGFCLAVLFAAVPCDILRRKPPIDNRKDLTMRSS
jgi:hypothetical protein